MFGTRVFRALSIVVVFSYAPVGLSAQTQLEPESEIKLPVSSSLGRFNLETISNQMSSMRVAPDQSLLVLDPDTNGQWPLARVKKWWTKEPVTEVLNIPGWSSKDAKHLYNMHVDLQITPDGRYAVCIAAAQWDSKEGFIFFAPPGYVQRKPDTLITVVDLERWQVVGSLHTAGLDDAEFTGARILKGWLALQGLDTEPETKKYEHLYDRRNLLISIPDLKPGPRCMSKWPDFGITDPIIPVEERAIPAAILSRDNNAACADVLKASGIDSVKALEFFIYKGHGIEPTLLMRRSLNLCTDEDEQNRVKICSYEDDPDKREEEEYYDHWNQPDHNMTFISSPYESPAHLWYGLHFWRANDTYRHDLDVFDADGHKLKEQPNSQLLCADRKDNNWPKGACGCHIEDVSEEQHTLLAYCQIQRGDYDGATLKQWLAVVRTDDLSDVGFVSLRNLDQMNIDEAIAVTDGHAYVLAVELGRTLRVYSIPDHP